MVKAFIEALAALALAVFIIACVIGCATLLVEMVEHWKLTATLFGSGLLFLGCCMVVDEEKDPYEGEL